MLAASPSNILNHYGPVQTDDKRLLFLKLASAVENQKPSGRSIDFDKDPPHAKSSLVLSKECQKPDHK